MLAPDANRVKGGLMTSYGMEGQGDTGCQQTDFEKSNSFQMPSKMACIIIFPLSLLFGKGHNFPLVSTRLGKFK